MNPPAFSILPIAASDWQSHSFHGGDRVWPETNCYVDVWIELLHAFGLDPIAALGFTVGIDFEGDQWTFFKFPLEDLRELFGVEVQEYALWRPLSEHLGEQAARDRLLIVEIDSWYLPDTAGVSYRKEHVKTSIAINSFDVDQLTLGYFHGPGYFEAHGEDVEGLLRLGDPSRFSVDVLPPYVEVIKRDRLVHRTNDELRTIARTLLAEHFSRRTDRGAANTCTAMQSFLQRFNRDIHTLATTDLRAFHGYAFATLRQVGASCELTGDHLRWLSPHGEFAVCAAEFTSVASSAKALQFKLARLAAGRTTDLSATCEELQRAWDSAFAKLSQLL
jgi:Domain of unknown function (DUF1839)